VNAARGVGGEADASAAEKFWATQEVEDMDFAIYEPWDGEVPAAVVGYVYFSGRTPSIEQQDGIRARGGCPYMPKGLPTNPHMALLVVDSTSQWREYRKAAHALQHNVPVAFFEELDEVLAEEEWNEDEDDEELEEEEMEIAAGGIEVVEEVDCMGDCFKF
jgi:hypothetical protein